MNSIVSVVLAVVLATIATPAAATGPAVLACVERETPHTQREAVVRSAEEMVSSGDGAKLPDAPKKAVEAAAAVCAKREGWTAKQAEAAGTYTLARLARGPIDAAVRRSGNDPLRWEQVVRALPFETSVDLATGDEAAVTEFSTRLEASGARLDVATLRLAGVLAAMVLIEDGANRRFAER